MLEPCQILLQSLKNQVFCPNYCSYNMKKFKFQSRCKNSRNSNRHDMYSLKIKEKLDPLKSNIFWL